jgi:hypothetical protein
MLRQNVIAKSVWLQGYTRRQKGTILPVHPWYCVQSDLIRHQCSIKYAAPQNQAKVQFVANSDYAPDAAHANCDNLLAAALTPCVKMQRKNKCKREMVSIIAVIQLVVVQGK